MVRRVTLLVFICLVCAITPAGAAPLTVNFRGTAALGTSTTDQNAVPFTVTGLSGVTYTGGTTYIAVMDNSDKLVSLNVALDANGGIASASINSGLTMDTVRDHEGIAFRNVFGSVFLSTEDPTPAIHEVSLLSGGTQQSIAAPAVFNNIRANLGLESLALSGSQMWTANEEALSTDGPRATATTGTTVRLLRYNIAGTVITAGPQFAYDVDPIHPGSFGSPVQSGLADIALTPDGRLIAMERSLYQGLPPFEIRLYEIDLSGATDVSLLGSLSGGGYTAAGKTLLWSSTSLNQNVEGLTFGPTLANGNWSLLGIVDDGDPLSTNAVVAWEVVNAVPEPSALTSALVGVATFILVFAFRVWRRSCLLSSSAR